MVRREVLDSCWLHYAVLVLLLAGASTGGLILLGCAGDQDAKALDPTQHYPGGGVIFREEDQGTEARVDLAPNYWDAPVKWYVPKYQPYAVIRDPNKSNELTILRPPDGVPQSEVTVEGDYTKNGTNYHITKHVHIENQHSTGDVEGG